VPVPVQGNERRELATILLFPTLYFTHLLYSDMHRVHKANESSSCLYHALWSVEGVHSTFTALKLAMKSI
jgi:hypothetical protein